MSIIAGLDTPSQGQVFVDGLDITPMSEARLAAVRNHKIGMVFQAFNLIPTLSAEENVEVPLYVVRHPDKPARRERGAGTREPDITVGQPANQRSSGEQQWVAIARALAADPAIAVMDEPTGNRDRQNGENVLCLIRDLHATTGVTVLVATHDAAVASSADRAIHLVSRPS